MLDFLFTTIKISCLKIFTGAMLVLFGQIAQSVEQRTENPCVPSSILGLANKIKHLDYKIGQAN